MIIQESWARFTERIWTEREYKRIARDKPIVTYSGVTSRLLDGREVYYLHRPEWHAEGYKELNLQLAWNRNIRQEYEKDYTPLWIDLWDGCNQRLQHHLENNNDSHLYPDDWIWIDDIPAL